MNSDFNYFHKELNNIVAVDKLIPEEEIKSKINFNQNSLDFDISIKDNSHRLQYFNSRFLALKLGKLYSLQNPFIKKNENGRPFLENENLQLSISHSPFYTAVMYSTNPCGVDIEYPREVVRKIQQKFLSENELKAYKDDIEQLTLIWSLKESMYKMLNRPGLLFKSQLELVSKEKDSAVMSYNEKNEKSFYRLKFKTIDKHVLTYVESSYRI
jgi:phosphopantetheinyl transferase